MAGTAVSDVGVSFFVASATLDDVAMSFCVTGAIFGMSECHFSWQAQHLVKSW